MPRAKRGHPVSPAVGAAYRPLTLSWIPSACARQLSTSGPNYIPGFTSAHEKGSICIKLMRTRLTLIQPKMDRLVARSTFRV